MQLPRSKKLHAETSNRFIGNQRCRYRSASQQAEPAEASVSSWYTCCSHNTLLAMDWFLSGMSKGQQTHHSSQSPGQGTAPKSIPVPQLQVRRTCCHHASSLAVSCAAQQQAALQCRLTAVDADQPLHNMSLRRVIQHSCTVAMVIGHLPSAMLGTGLARQHPWRSFQLTAAAQRQPVFHSLPSPSRDKVLPT
jgi:hypothetical protein